MDPVATTAVTDLWWQGALQWLGAAYPAITATSLAMARCLGLVMISPVFNRLGITGLLRTVIAMVFAVPVVPMLLPDVMYDYAHVSYRLVGALMVEMLVGMVLGALYGVPVWAAEAAGELIDLQRGSTMAQLVDPLSATESGVTATLLSVVMVAMFFLAGGLSFMLRGLYDSYRIWPLGGFFPVMDGMGLAVLQLMDEVLRLAVMMIAPLMIAILVCDLVLAYLARMAPSLHVFDLSMPVKNFLFAILLLLYMAVLLPDMADLVASARSLSDWVDALR